MPRSKLSAEEQVDNLNRRASEALQCLRRRKLELLMKNRPSMIEHLWEKARSLGVTDELINLAEEGPKQSVQAAAVQGRKQRKLEADAAKEEELVEAGGDAGAVLLMDKVPPKAQKLEDLPITAFQTKLLPGLESSVLSAPNLRTMAKDPKFKGKETLLKMWCYLTGLPHDLALVGGLRCYTQLVSLGCERNETRGRRGTRMTLPPDFDGEDGLYFIVGPGTKQGTIEVQHRFTNCVRVVPAADVPPHKSRSQLYLHNGHSEQLASLASTMNPSNDKQFFLINLFKAQFVDREYTTPTKRQKLGDCKIEATLNPSASEMSPSSPQTACGADELPADVGAAAGAESTPSPSLAPARDAASADDASNSAPALVPPKAEPPSYEESGVLPPPPSDEADGAED